MTDLVINFDNPLEKQALYATLKAMKGVQVIKIKKKSKGRSLQENRYYWGCVLQYISDYTGESPYILHEHFKNQFIPLVKFTDEYRLSTSDMTHDQIWEYINVLRQWAKDFLDLAIPDPDGVIL